MSTVLTAGSVGSSCPRGVGLSVEILTMMATGDSPEAECRPESIRYNRAPSEKKRWNQSADFA